MTVNFDKSGRQGGDMATSRSFTNGNDKDYANGYPENYLYLLGGDDAIFGTNSDFVFMYGGRGNDDVAYASTGVATLYGGPGSDDLDNGAGSAVCFLYGGKGADRLDTDRSSGDSYLYGGSGNDSFWGGDGSETLYGGAGRDDITGRRGSDDIYGGKGIDDYTYEHVKDSLPTAEYRDTIYGFERPEKINLIDIDANANQSGNQAFHFIGKKSFQGAAGELRFKNGLLQGDVDGDKSADFELRVVGVKIVEADLYL